MLRFRSRGTVNGTCPVSSVRESFEYRLDDRWDRVFVDHAEEIGDDCVFPTEYWATTFRSYGQQVLSDIVMEYGYSEPNLPETWYQKAK